MERDTLDLRDYLSILWTHKLPILTIVGVTVFVALAYSVTRPAVFNSSTEVIVTARSFTPSDPSSAFAQINMSTEEQIANSSRVADLASSYVVDRGLTPGTASASRVTDAETLSFTAEASDARSAQATAEAYAQAYIDFRREGLESQLEAARGPYETQILQIDGELDEIDDELASADEAERSLLVARYTSLLSQRSSLAERLSNLVAPESLEAGRILRPADLPGGPASPDPLRDGAVGILVGLGLGIGFAFVRDRLDEPVRDRGELEGRMGAPVLAFIPSSGWTPRFRGRKREADGEAEAFRALRVRFVRAAEQRGCRVVLLSSAFPWEGKTTVTARLGVALAEAGSRVVIVSADLRKPNLQTLFPARANGSGLAQVLKGGRSARRALATTSTKNLWILHAGRSLDSVDPSKLLASGSMSDVLEELRAFADFVLLDTPPLLSSPDIVALAPHVDGALLVVDASVAQQPSIEQARHELDAIELPILGIVVTNHDPGRFRAVGTGYRYYVEEPHGSVIPESQSASVQPSRVAVGAQVREPAHPEAGETSDASASSVRAIHDGTAPKTEGADDDGSGESRGRSSVAPPGSTG